MRAAVLNGIGAPINIENRPDLTPGPGEARVRIRAAALNRRDVWIRLGKYAGLKFPIVLGSDGVGTVDAVGSEGEEWVGKDAIIYPALSWGDSEAFQGASFEILGLPRDGTFSEQVIVPIENLCPKPDHMSDHEAAALPLAGLTAFRAVCSRARLKAGEKVLVTGAGGGTATLAVQFAAALGGEVYVTSGSPQKLATAAKIGAKGGANYKDADWADKLKKMAGGFDVIVDSAMGEGFSKLIELANPGGRIVFFGATAGDPPELPARRVFWKQLSILGATMGSPADFSGMLDLVAAKQIRPVIDKVFPLAQTTAALDRMYHSQQFGKIVLDV